MKTYAVAVLALAAAGTSSTYAQRSGPAAAPDGTGRMLYATHCASCHGTAARGDGPIADALRVRPADLTQLAERNGGMFPAAKTHRVIDGREVGAHGNPDMPVWGDAFKRSRGLTEEEVTARIESIVRYLESLQARVAQ